MQSHNQETVFFTHLLGLRRILAGLFIWKKNGNRDYPINDCSMQIETWFIILLAVIAVMAVTMLLFLSLLGDDVVPAFRMKHRRGDYINDQTAVIYQTVIDTKDPHKAFIIFIEYIFTNHRQYLEIVAEILKGISEAYLASDDDAVRSYINKIYDMKTELKDQKITQDACVESIDPANVIESSAWINLAMEQRFTIIKSMRRIANACLQYHRLYEMPIPDEYTEQLSQMVQDICNVCESARNLILARDIEGMRELRLRSAVIKSESYDIAQRLYELLHDGKMQLDPERRIALSYALNAFQECHCIIYALRRLILCNICLMMYSDKN